MKSQDAAASTAHPVDASRIDDPIRLQVSALIDGELDAATVESTIDALLASDDLARFWSDAHRAGDWMRSDEVLGVGDGELFVKDFALRLAAEPTILAPRARGGRSRRFWVRTGLPGASVAAALVVVAWVAVPFGRDAGGDKSAAATPTVMVVSNPGSTPGLVPTAGHVVAPVDPDRLTDYLAAHRDITSSGYRGGAAARPVAFSPATRTESSSTR